MDAEREAQCVPVDELPAVHLVGRQVLEEHAGLVPDAAHRALALEQVRVPVAKRPRCRCGPARRRPSRSRPHRRRAAPPAGSRRPARGVRRRCRGTSGTAPWRSRSPRCAGRCTRRCSRGAGGRRCGRPEPPTPVPPRGVLSVEWSSLMMISMLRRLCLRNDSTARGSRSASLYTITVTVTSGAALAMGPPVGTAR